MSKAERERTWKARSAEFKASEMNGSKWYKEHDLTDLRHPKALRLRIFRIIVFAQTACINRWVYTHRFEHLVWE